MKKYLALTVLLFAFSSVHSQVARLVLHEQFTNASCGPCASYNPAYNALLASNSSKITKISYQANFPGADPMNAANPGPVSTRRNYYSNTSVPRCYNFSMYGSTGINPASVTQAQIDARYNTAPDWSVDATASTLIAEDWLADRHQLGLSLDDDSTATVRTYASAEPVPPLAA